MEKALCLLVIVAISVSYVVLLTLTLYNAVSPKAQEIRLVGICNGVYMAAMEEDHFPKEGCLWIESAEEMRMLHVEMND